MNGSRFCTGIDTCQNKLVHSGSYTPRPYYDSGYMKVTEMNSDK